MYGTVIEIEAYGDFDMRYTDCIMVTEEVFDVGSLVKSFCSEFGLDCVNIHKGGVNGLPDNMLRDTNESFKKWLKKQAFRELKTKSVCFSD